MRYIVRQFDFVWYLFYNWLSGIFGKLSVNMGTRGLAHLIEGKLERRLPEDLNNYAHVIVSVDPDGQAMVTPAIVFEDIKKAKESFEKKYNVKVIFFQSLNSMLYEAVASIALGEEKYL